jgi:invasion protein IalB
MVRVMRALLALLAIVMIIAAQAEPAAGRGKKVAATAKSAEKASSAPSEALGSADSWNAYTYKQKGGRVCYLIAQPEKSTPPKANRRQPMAMVTHRPAEKAFNVVSFNVGYPLKEGSDVAVDIGGGKFTLFTKGDAAWAATAALDTTIVRALAKGKLAVVTGTSQRGTTTVDTYSLTGFTKALGLIDAACGVKR